MAGLAADGGMAEYMIGDAENCVLIPENVSFEQAAPLMCAGVGIIQQIDVMDADSSRQRRGRVLKPRASRVRPQSASLA